MIKRRLKTPRKLPFSTPLWYFWPAMKMIVIILLCFLAPGTEQPAHATHELKAQKHFLVTDAEAQNEDEDENEPFSKRLNLFAGTKVITHDAFFEDPNHYKNSQGPSGSLPARYIFHGVLRI